MAKPLKKWKTVECPNGEEFIHRTEARAYSLVNTLRSEYQDWKASGRSTRPSTTGVTVYEYDPVAARWQLFDAHDFRAGT